MSFPKSQTQLPRKLPVAAVAAEAVTEVPEVAAVVLSAAVQLSHLKSSTIP